jgi:hypothetical protein
MPTKRTLLAVLFTNVAGYHGVHAFVSPGSHASLGSSSLLDENHWRIYSTARTSTRYDRKNEVVLLQPDDYAITDSQDLVDRPSAVDFFMEPRNAVALLLMIAGTTFSFTNVLGNYDSDSYPTLEAVSIGLGAVNALYDYQLSLPPYTAQSTPTVQSSTFVSPNVRLGVVDDALLHLYSGVYTGCACWLALRTSLLPAPSWVPALDWFIGPLALEIFAFSLACPVLTLIYHETQAEWSASAIRFMVNFARQQSSDEQDVKALDLSSLSETELLRARALLAIGVVGCIYAPEVISFLSLGQQWWVRVYHAYPAQPTLESSTALFGVFATQASMVAHRAGKAGVGTFSDLVPAFSAVCLMLTILPCAAALYWLGNDISFFDFYSV